MFKIVFSNYIESLKCFFQRIIIAAPVLTVPLPRNPKLFFYCIYRVFSYSWSAHLKFEKQIVCLLTILESQHSLCVVCGTAEIASLMTLTTLSRLHLRRRQYGFLKANGLLIIDRRSQRRRKLVQGAKNYILAPQVK